MKWVSDDDDDFGDDDDYVLFYGISDSERTAGVFSVLSQCLGCSQSQNLSHIRRIARMN